MKLGNFRANSWAVICAAAVFFMGNSSIAATPVVYYDFTSGSLVNQANPGFADGTMNDGEANFINDAVWGNVLKFDGSQFLDSSTNASTLGIGGYNEKTAIMWVKMDALADNMGLFDVGNNATLNQFGIRGRGDGQWRLQYYGRDKDFRTSTETHGDWMQVAVTYADGHSRVYFNGQEYTNLNAVLNVTDTRSLRIGQYGANTVYLKAEMANFALYDKMLTPAEIQQQLVSTNNSISQNLLAKQASAKTINFSFDGTLEDSGTLGATLTAYSKNPNEAITPTYRTADELGGRQVLVLDGSTYLSTAEKISELGITGLEPRTVSVLAKVDAFNDGGLYDMGANTNGNDFCLRTTPTDNQWRMQFFGGDKDVTLSGSKGNWGLYTMTYDSSTATLYYNGVKVTSYNRDLNTSDSELFIGLYHLANKNCLTGEMADFQVSGSLATGAEVAASYNSYAKTMGGFAYSFDGALDHGATGSLGETDWMVGCGSNAIRATGTQGDVLATVGECTGLGVISFPSQPNNINTASTNADDTTGMLWGPVFTVTDETADISFRISGGKHALNQGSKTAGGAGVALWDMETGEIIESTYTTRSGNSGNWENASISLAGLEGKQVMLVGLDRQVGSWAWFGIDSVMTPFGSTKLWDEGPMHKVVNKYHFDTPGDMEGWTQTAGADGVFKLGSAPQNARMYIDSSLEFQADSGFLASTAEGIGVLESEKFTIDFDVIEFMINGGSGADLGLDLMIDYGLGGGFEQAETSQNGRDSADFVYDYWSVLDYKGLDAYLRLRDDATGTWGWIGVDNIQMLGFGTMDANSATPEPATWVMLLLGGGCLVWWRKKRG